MADTSKKNGAHNSAKYILNSVSKTYPSHQVHALSEVSLTISTGERVALMGPSGCGKSTLLNILGAMDQPSSGSVQFDSLNLAALNDDQLSHIRATRIGFVFQFFNLLSTLTVSENVALPLELQRKLDAAAKQRVTACLEKVGMDQRASFFPSQLSGGEMQRVAIARALIMQPEVILADEPTGNLDSVNGQNVLDLLESLCTEMKITLVMATHSDEAAKIATRIVRMRDGKIESL
ncbi:MAG: ABC transporter ATP-binding protein [Cyanobacteria bacterium]|nr:ABC transporter ATP-binding protein [Cyanobacteriota bacterium]